MLPKLLATHIHGAVAINTALSSLEIIKHSTFALYVEDQILYFLCKNIFLTIKKIILLHHQNCSLQLSY